MLLRPRKFSHKNVFKRRVILKPRDQISVFNFGTQSLCISKNVALTSQKMFRLKLILKKGSRRTDKTSRKLWFNAFPHLPLTKKVIGSRMGKGKGKLNSWFTVLTSGNTLFEFKNLRQGRFLYFSKQIEAKLGCKCFTFQKYDILKKTSYFYIKSNRRKNFSLFL